MIDSFDIAYEAYLDELACDRQEELNYEYLDLELARYDYEYEAMMASERAMITAEHDRLERLSHRDAFNY